MLWTFLAIYFLSGFSALVYQVVWQRMLAIFSGSDLYATTTIVASFMAGLGAGSLIGGPLADRLSPRRQIGMFALAEFLIGVFALVSKWWYYDVLYVRHADLANSPVVLALVLFSSLLIPTFCMGMSFPLLAKALTPAIESAGRRIGLLYALNTMGAAVGAFATAWLLMGDRDLPRILRMGARISILAGLIALLLGVVLRRKLGTLSVAAGKDEPIQGDIKPHEGFSFATWMWIYTLSGFLALSLEIVWFRLLGVILKSNSFTFPHLLAVYLFCLAIGIMAGARLVRWGRRPGQVCLGLQAGITIYTALSIAALLWAVDAWGPAQWLRAYLAGYEPFDAIPFQNMIRARLSDPVGFLRALAYHQDFLKLYVLVPAFVIAPPSFMMGASFPFLQRAVQDSRASLGRKVGWLQAANIFGSTLGAVLVGTVLLHYLGTSWTLRLLIALGGIFVALWSALVLQLRIRRAGFIAALAIPGILMWMVAPGPVLWAKLHGAPLENAISSEDGSGVSVLKNENADFSSTTFVYVNGLGQSWIPFYHTGIHSSLGILPVMLHPAPKSVAVIGLGSGDTPFSLGGRDTITEVTCLEIVKPMAETLRLLQARRPYGGLESLLSDSRFNFVFTDGRRYLGSSAKKYDVIEADALRPTSAFAGNLYSYEYFLLLRSRLNPGGLAATWAPSLRVVETFAKAFPYVYLFESSILIGSDQPVDFDLDAIGARLDSPFSQAYYEKAGIDAKSLLLPFLGREPEQLRVDPAISTPYGINTDLHPKDEYGR